jgi:hypothetical protein
MNLSNSNLYTGCDCPQCLSDEPSSLSKIWSENKIPIVVAGSALLGYGVYRYTKKGSRGSLSDFNYYSNDDLARMGRKDLKQYIAKLTEYAYNSKMTSAQYDAFNRHLDKARSYYYLSDGGSGLSGRRRRKSKVRKSKK